MSPPAGSAVGRAIVITPFRRPRHGANAKAEGRPPAARLDEAVGLARAIDLDVVESGLVALGDIRHAHPALGEMNLYQWALWIAGHEARHAAQVREIAAQLDGSTRAARG